MDRMNISRHHIVVYVFMKKNHLKKRNGKFECNQMKNTNQPIMTKAFFPPREDEDI